MISRMYKARKAEATNYPRRNTASEHFPLNTLITLKVVNICFRLAAERIEEEDLKDLTCSPLSTSPQISIFKKTGAKSPNCDVTTSRQHIYNVSFRF